MKTTEEAKREFRKWLKNYPHETPERIAIKEPTHAD